MKSTEQSLIGTMASRANAVRQLVRQPTKTIVNNRPQATAQRKLQTGIDKISTHTTTPIQRKLTIGHGKSRQVYKDLPADPASGDARYIKESIKNYTGEVKAIYKYIRNLSKDPTENYVFPSLEAVIRKAIRKHTLKIKDDGVKVHFASAPMSPYTPYQEDMIEYLNGDGRDAEHMKPKAVWNELKINGQIGECSHQNSLRDDGMEYEDANNFLGYNTPGIDTLCNEEGRCFGQSKMHMADGKDAASIAQDHLKHVEAAVGYSKAFLRSILVDTTTAQKRRDKIIELAEDWENETLQKLAGYISKEKYIASKSDLEDLLDGSVNAKGKIEESKIVRLVVRAMHFPVPKDVYKYIKHNHADSIDYFTKLPYSLYDMRKVKAGMEYRYNKPKKSEEELDSTYKPD